MEIRVSPTRMELLRLRTRLAMAKRGHKLLKDKRDELMRRFLELVRKNKELREALEGELATAFRRFSLARALMSRPQVEAALMLPKQSVTLTVGERNMMTVRVPKLTYKLTGPETTSSNPLPYGFAETSAELDEAIRILTDTLTRLLALAEVEQTANALAKEIEKTRRRVNALEYVLIPQLEEKVREITMRLDENERGNLTRLLKVKDIVAAKG